MVALVVLPSSYYDAISAKRRAEALELEARPAELPDPEYADVDEDGQLTLGIAGEQRSIPGLAAPRKEA